MDIFNSMSTMKTHASFENNFVSILDKHGPKKIKNFTRESKTHFNKNLREQVMIRSSLSDKETWWQI